MLHHYDSIRPFHHTDKVVFPVDKNRPFLHLLVVMMMIPDLQEMGPWSLEELPRRRNSRATSQGLNRVQKWKKLCHWWRAGEIQMRDNSGSELDPANDVRRRCKMNSPSVLSCIGTGTKEG